MTLPSFKFGNRELAEQLGPEVIGEPLTEEKRFGRAGNVDTYQVTTMGVVFYFAELPGLGLPGSQFAPFTSPRPATNPEPVPGPTPERPPILDTTGVDRRALIEAAATMHNIPAVLLLAGMIAESGLNPEAERWGMRTVEAQSYITRGDNVLLQALCYDVYPDLGFGFSQRIVLYHYLGDGTASIANVLAVRRLVFANPERDVYEMAAKLADCRQTALMGFLSPVGGDVLLGALVAYNAGHLPGEADSWWVRWAGNVASYRAALAEAAGMS